MHGRKLDLHTFKSVILVAMLSAVVGTALALLLIHKPMQSKRDLQEKVATTCQQFRETIKIMGTNEVEAQVSNLVTIYKRTLCDATV